MICSILMGCCMNAGFAMQTPHFTITQAREQTIDESIELKVDGLEPFQEITIQVETKDQKGDLWASHATFKANAAGTVDVANTAPESGSSYSSADAMGLFWSMLPLSNDETLSFKCKGDAYPVEIKLLSRGQLIERAEIIRYVKSPDVQRLEVNEEGLVGALFIPRSAKPLPVIITLSGSNGGLGENRAKLLASNGFAVLALGYFGVEGLPPNLQEIPLEYFETAFAWLRKQPIVDGSRIGLYGTSRGAELALLLGSLFPDQVSAITAVVPSSVIHGGLGETPIDAWTYRGKPIASFAPVASTDFSNGKGLRAETPANTRANFMAGMQDETAFEAAMIPVEKIKCPILLISGGDDQMWPSEVYANQILERLKIQGSTIQAQHLNYPDAGHGIGLPNHPIPGPIYYHPVGKCWFSMGGNRAADAAASRDAWNQTKVFFHQNLDTSTILRPRRSCE